MDINGNWMDIHWVSFLPLDMNETSIGCFIHVGPWISMFLGVGVYKIFLVSQIKLCSRNIHKVM